MANFDDPLNLIICGVGGQGNVAVSRLIGRALVREGYFVTIGETFGAAQRGGAVMSHVRISKKRPYGPLMPLGKAHLILSLEPMETLRMLGDYGNPEVITITNFYPILPVGVLMGQTPYPDYEELKEAIRQLSRTAWFVNATQVSIELGTPVVANLVTAGALIGAHQLPLGAQNVEDAIRDSFSSDRIQVNLKAFNIGVKLVQEG